MGKGIDVMVISAHPDDAEFGVAGTVARWIHDGKTVMYVVCTSGDKGTSDPSLDSLQLKKIRENEQLNAGKILGVKEILFLKYPDQELEDTPEFRKEIVRIIRSYKPHTIVTSDPYRRYLWHRDHRIVGQVVMDAVFPYARDRLAYPEMISEGLEPHKVREIWFWAAEEINHRSDITQTFIKKLDALRCHESQVKELGVENLEIWLKNRCKHMAQGQAFELAEAFHRIVLPD